MVRKESFDGFEANPIILFLSAFAQWKGQCNWLQGCLNTEWTIHRRGKKEIPCLTQGVWPHPEIMGQLQKTARASHNDLARAALYYFISSSSTTKCNVAFGGITGGAPRAPYPIALGIWSSIMPPWATSCIPSVQPGMTPLSGNSMD